MNNFEKKFEEKYSVINKVLEEKTVVIVDPQNEYKQLAERFRSGGKVVTIDTNSVSYINPFELSSINEVKILQKYKSNNWLKMHGIPMRRKPMKREKPIYITDEFHTMFDQ